jgi:hypothetical protein
MIRKLIFSLSILVVSVFLADAQITFGPNSSFKYLKGKDAASIPANWMTANFAAADWKVGNAPFWYGDGTDGTLLNDMINSYSTVYLRSTFTAVNVKELQDVNFSVNFDDGFIVWINGEEAIRVNAPVDHPYNSFSTDLHESGTFELYTLPARDLELTEGENLIAIQAFNTSLESSDFHINIQLSANYTPPVSVDTMKVVFSKPNGFYTNPFDLQLDVPDPAYNILYTIDGSNPQSSTTVQNGGKSKTITINPASIAGRDKTPCFIVRASLKKDGEGATFPLTQTYIFLDQVIHQTAPGGKWPAPGTVNGQVIDLEMDTKVTSDPKYAGQMKDDLLDIPSISVVTDLPNLFDPTTGIYVNAESHGESWERLCSVELINPSGKPGFNINAGLRIRGGWSRHNYFPKHAFRLFFRSDYGAPKLKYPLFENEGVDEFDKIDLRCEQNYAWSHPPGDDQRRQTAVREVFSRDTQGKMGEPYTRSRYYHLYLNGMYWGLYQTQERSEARFAESYFGGSSEDYDIVKVNTEGYTVEATDGNLDSWQKLYNLCTAGFTTNAAYYALEGKDQNGKPKKGGEVMVDIDNLIDYMQLIFYTGNFDAPTSSFGNNQMANNFYAIDRRDDKSSGFKFFAHDSEHTMMIESQGPGVGLQENRVQLTMAVGGLFAFHPQWLHYKLSSNKEYRQRFADRAYRNFYNNGVFVPAQVQARFQERVDQINKAIVCESARWGDFTTGSNPPYTWEDWDREIKDIYARFVPYRTKIVIDQMKAAKLLVDFNPPTLTKDNVQLKDEAYTVSGSYKVTLSSATGQIFYTLDGSDPRLIGGMLNSTAKEITTGNAIDLNGTALIKARVRLGSDWSALAQVKFLNSSEDFSNLKVTEIHYHPTDTIAVKDTVSGKSFEFLELKNTGDKTINLTGLKFTSAIDYQFKANEVLPPHQFYVIASKPKWFYERHWMVPSGNFEKNFSNTGEQVIITTSAGSPVIDFMYSNVNPWATLPDGAGNSLTAGKANPTGNPNDYSYWSASSVYDGTPFADDMGVVDTILDPADNDNLLTIYPNPTKGLLNLKVKDPNSTVDIEIYNLSGTMIYKSSAVGTSSVDLARLNIRSGLYLVNTKINQKNSVFKVVYQP